MDMNEAIKQWTTEQNDKAASTMTYIESLIKKEQKKQEDIWNLTYEHELIKNDIINNIQNNLGISAYNIFRMNHHDIFDKVFSYSHFHKEEDKSSYEYALSTIKNCLVPKKYIKKIELEDIKDYNYGSSYWFYFMIEDIKFVIEIPVFWNANGKNYTSLLSGYCLRQEDDCFINLIDHDINPDAFKEKLEKWLSKELKKGEKA